MFIDFEGFENGKEHLETGSGFEGLKSLIISDQIILTRLYKEELKHRTSEFK